MVNTVNEPRVEQLKELLLVLAEQIDSKPGARDMASLARQYRETLKEIEEIEGTTDNDDDIGQLLAKREADGKAGAVR
jgi:hypothetical protein